MGTLLSPAVHKMLLTCETIYWLSKGVSKNLSGEGGPDFDGKSKEIFLIIFTRQVTGTHVFARILM